MLQKFPHRPRSRPWPLAPSTLPLRPLSTGLDALPNAHLERNVSIEMAVALAAVLELRPERPGGAHSPSRFSNFPSRRLNDVTASGPYKSCADISMRLNERAESTTTTFCRALFHAASGLQLLQMVHTVDCLH